MEESGMAKPPRILTAFGKDLDALLEKAGKLSIREYADQANVSYKYVLQLRTMADRQPGRLYPNLLKPFVQIKVIDLADSHQLSLRHRNKPLSIAECQELFPDIPEQELAESIKRALEPESSHEVALETVAPSLLYHRVFVGRDAELGALRSAFDNAVSSQGSLVMVAGEPGIGKTALCERLSTYVSSHGGKTLVGHCYSEKSLSLPYLAFAEVLRSIVQAEDVSELRKELGSGAATLGRIVPEIAEMLRIPPRQKGDLEEDRYRLMEAVTQFLGNIAAVQPLLIVLEDLHNADKDTLEILTHVSRYLEGKRFLLVGTYRDVEVDRTHPLSATLAELRRLPNFGRVLVKGLNADDVRRMISSITGQDVPRRLSESIHRQTEGNPLFVQEVTRYLVEEGLFSLQGEIQQSAKDVSVEMRLPDGLRDVIGKRLSGLSEPCNKVLAVAAVIGRDFPLEVLRKIAGLSDEEIFKALEEAKKAAVIEERSEVGATVSYHFAHAFFRQTLYEEIIAPRRNRLHQQVAQALEEVYNTRSEEHAAELTEHFYYSSDSAELKKAVTYGEMAAKKATDIYAYGEAVRLLEQVIRVQEIIDPEDKAKRCDLLLAYGQALLWTGEYRRVLDVELPAALSLAEELKDNRRASRACELAIIALTAPGLGNPGGWQAPEAIQWVEHADRHAEPHTSARVLADSALGMVKWATGYPREGTLLLGRAVDLGRKLDDTNILWGVVFNWISHVQSPQHIEERLRLAEEMTAVPRPSEGISRSGGVFSYLVDAFLQAGQRKRAEEIHREFQEQAERSGQPYMLLATMSDDIDFALFDGHLNEALEIGQRTLALGEEFGIPALAAVFDLYRVTRPRLHLGKVNEALQTASMFPAIHPFIEAGALCLAHLGRDTEVIEILEQRVFARPDIGSTEDETWAWPDVLLLEAVVMVGQQRAADLLMRRFSGAGLHTTGQCFATCTARHLGAAAVLLGRPEEARKHYDEAIRVCTEMRFRPELALSRLQLAELLLEHYPDEKSEALEHLNFAISEFREMKMQPSLERALRHKEILGA
jgi:tetratricopeptide (TPR) repeat protein